MEFNENIFANVAYIEHIKSHNPKLKDIKCSGKYLEYLNEKIDISEIYIQDILTNKMLFDSLGTIEAEDFLTIIKLHIGAIKIKEKEFIYKMGEMKNEHE